jgi:trimeric autotransporter adhesin
LILSEYPNSEKDLTRSIIMKKNFTLVVVFLILLFASSIKAQIETPPVYSPTGRINTMLARGDTLIVGGVFNAVGKYTGGGALFTATSDQPNLIFPKINGAIISSTSDGNGGFYIYGSYYRENESSALSSVRIEHILADNTFEPNFSIAVNTLFVNNTKILFHNGNLYITGQNVSQIGGQAAGNLSAINVTTKQLLPWIPTIVGTAVTGVFAKGNSLYIIGAFTSVKGVNRLNAASIEIGTGNIRAWNPSPNWVGGYSDLAFYGNQIIIAGGFHDGTFTNHACAFVDTLSGSNYRYIFRSGGLFGDGTSALYWAAGVSKITIDGNVLYAFSGGTFDTRITAVNLLAVNLPNTSGTIWGKYFNMIANARGMAVIGNSLYVVGTAFDNICTTNLDNTNSSNIERSIKSAVRLNKNTGNSENWNPNPVGNNRDSWTMSVSGSNIFIGGGFTHVNGIDRDGIYMVNSQSDEILPFNLIKNNEWFATVNALKIIDNTLYIAGATLKNPSNQSIYNVSSPVVAYNLNTGNVLNWNVPNLGEAFTVEANSQNVFIGGYMFEPAGGSGRQHLFAIDRNTGALANWSPNPNDRVWALHIANNQLYVGGYFTTTSGQSRIKAGSYSLPSLTLTNWNPTLGNFDIVRTLYSNNSSTIWLGGGFSSVGGVAKKGFSAVNSTTGAVINSPNPTVNAYPTNYSISSKGCFMFIGGDFDTGSPTCRNLMAYDFYNKSFLNTNSLCVNIELYGGIVSSTAVSRNDLFFGGNFLKVNGKIVASYIGRIRYPASFFDPCGDFISVQNGNWNSPTTWNRGVVPLSSAKVTIKHQVTVTQTTSCQSVFEAIGGKVQVNTGVSLNLLADY